MTRIETFVAASFAFAVTMLVISVGTIPATFEELHQAMKEIPAFLASGAIIVWIWHAHATWSRRYGLEDGTTILLSALLIFLVLIYIYPLRLMMQGLFSSLSGGYLPFDMGFSEHWQIRLMFVFYAAGYVLLSVTFVCLYLHARNKRRQLVLNNLEIFDTQTHLYLWLPTLMISLLALLLAALLPQGAMSVSGYTYVLLGPVLSFIGITRGRMRSRRYSVGQAVVGNTVSGQSDQ